MIGDAGSVSPLSCGSVASMKDAISAWEPRTPVLKLVSRAPPSGVLLMRRGRLHGDDAARRGVTPLDRHASSRRRIDGVHVDIRRHYEGTANVDCRAGSCIGWVLSQSPRA